MLLLLIAHVQISTVFSKLRASRWHVNHKESDRLARELSWQVIISGLLHKKSQKRSETIIWRMVTLPKYGQICALHILRP